MKQDWHCSEEFNRLVLEYHDKFARQPSIVEAKAELQRLKEQILQQMETQGLFKCMGFVYKGSTYEGVQVTKSEGDCPEFDLDFIIKGGAFLEATMSDKSDSFYELKEKTSNSCEILNKAKEDKVISPLKVMQLFYGSLIKCGFQKTYNVVQRYHGPAVQLDIYHPQTDDLWFRVDLAPAFYLEGQNRSERFSECFIAKSLDESFYNLWYKSHSIDEKRLLEKAKNQRKVVLRTLKAMRGHSSQLSGLQSYHMKMALFGIMDKFPHDSEWIIDKTGERFVDALEYIYLCMETGEMPNYFNKTENIQKLKEIAASNLRNKISGLLKNKERMFKFLRDRIESFEPSGGRKWQDETLRYKSMPPLSRSTRSYPVAEVVSEDDSSQSTSWLGLGLRLSAAAAAGYAVFSLLGNSQNNHGNREGGNNTSRDESGNNR